MSESEESISEPGSPTADSEMQVDVKSEVQSETVESTGPDDDECESMSFYDMNALDFLKYVVDDTGLEFELMTTV